MIQKWSRYAILEEFFDKPREDFHIREMSREIKLAQTSVTNHLKILLKEDLIIKEKKGIYSTFKANMDSGEYKLLKKQNLIFRVSKSGLLEYLEKKFYPNCIILFGSGSRGEDIERSDIDLFIQSKRCEVNLSKFEKKLKRKVALFFEPKIENLSQELLNNIVNGDILYGYLKIK